MARIRSVSPDICTSEKMAGLSAELERTFVRLWTHCDDHGRCVDNPRLIKAGIFPLHDEMTPAAIDADLDELEEHGLILRYEADGKPFLSVSSWDEYQHPQRPRPSKYPVPLDASRTRPRRIPDVYVSGEGEGEGEGDGDGRGIQEASTALMVVPVADKFDDFWKVYPRRIGKGTARKAWDKATGRTEPNVIIAGAIALAGQGIETKFIPHPTTWLNRDGWEDDHTIAPRMPRGADATARSLEWMKGQG
jgi:hypothetical protein